MLRESPLLVFSGRANPELTEAICGYLQIEMGRMRLGNFSDGELYCQIEENARGADVFLSWHSAEEGLRIVPVVDQAGAQR